MKPEEMYRDIPQIKTVVDAYSVIVPFGGAFWQCPGQERLPIAIDSAPLVVRALIVEGRAKADVTIDQRKLEVSFEHQELGGVFWGSILEPLSGNADAYVRAVKAAGRVRDISQWLERLLESFDMQLSLPYWILTPAISTTNMLAVRSALQRCRYQAERYRHDIEWAIRDAFGRDCEVTWGEELQEGTGPVEFAPMYRAFRAAGHDLRPIREEAAELSKMLVGLGVLTVDQAQRVLLRFDRSP